MPRPKSLVPAYSLHKATGRAVVYVDRKPVYLGRYNSPHSRQRYSELLDQLRSGSVDSKSGGSARRQFAIGELCLKFGVDELPRYSVPEQRCVRVVLRIVGDLFAETPTNDFGPLRLRTVRQAMIGKGWSRSFVNKQIARLKHIFRWGVSWELVPESVVNALSTVTALTRGESEAPESRPRSAIPEEQLKSVRAVLCERHQDLFDLMLLTGARPGELLSLTTGMIDRSGEVWRSELSEHKTAHKGKRRVLFFNGTAQAILSRYFLADPDRKIFPLRVDTFSAAVKSACEAAFGMPDELRNVGRTVQKMQNVTDAERAALRKRLSREAREWRRQHVFTPHWLRHTVATRLADDVGTEAAQRLLGHANSAMTEHYARKADRQAIDAAKRLG